jgi:hypothetical protein
MRGATAHGAASRLDRKFRLTRLGVNVSTRLPARVDTEEGSNMAARGEGNPSRNKTTVIRWPLSLLLGVAGPLAGLLRLKSVAVAALLPRAVATHSL